MVKNKELIKYLDLIEKYIDFEISVELFEKQYLQMVKSETTIFNEKEARIIETLFSDLDAYCGDPSIANYDPNDPFPNINEEELRQRAKHALQQLK